MILLKKAFLILILLLLACDTGNITTIADLPKKLSEASGMEITSKSNLIWMLNDGGNKSRLYGLNEKGKIVKELKIDAKNKDWEDLTSDPNGNLYIGDFGNNRSSRKNLAILKVSASDLESDSLISVERIGFKYPNQKKFPPKKKQMYFDSEAFLFYNDSLYIFTKSRVKDDFGRTDLYKVPAKKGQHEAIYIDSFTTCNDLACWITAADINEDQDEVVLLTHQSVWSFTDFEMDNFFKGTVVQYDLGHRSQKEAICFKTDSLLYITDERSHGGGGNLYKFVRN